MNVGSLRCPKPRKKAKEGKERIRQRGDIYPYYWHILPLGNEKFCLLSLYADQISDHDGLNPYWKYYVRFGTFGLVDDALSGRSPCPSKPLMPSKPLSRGFPQSTPSTPKNQIQKGKAPSRGFQSKTTPKKQIWVQKGKAPFQSNTQFLSSPETTPKNQTQKEKAPGGRVEIASPSKEYRMKNLKIKYIDIAVQKKKLELLPYSIVCSKM
ncbi:cell division control protein 54 [Corchorus olitorius]|uniref:Cell division control protein 54 n=1 Tax=Corchorus olitorius TaxID=93759 RepID=A0A1R3H5T8_9ROSI|nr:cell division control protein 54 [Corchorus olitorius]